MLVLADICDCKDFEDRFANGSSAEYYEVAREAIDRWIQLERQCKETGTPMYWAVHWKDKHILNII